MRTRADHGQVRPRCSASRDHRRLITDGRTANVCSQFNSWDRDPLLYTAEDGSLSVTPKTHQLRGNLIFNANFLGATQSGYCIDWDDASSNYNATGNVLVFGGVKLSGGSNRSVSGNLVVGGKLAVRRTRAFLLALSSQDSVI